METIKQAVTTGHAKYVLALAVIAIAVYGGFMWGQKAAQAPTVEIVPAGQE